MAKNFPVKDTAIVHAMFEDIGEVINDHLGFYPPEFVLILSDHKQNQTFYAGDPAPGIRETPGGGFTKLLTEGYENHMRYRRGG